MPAERGFSFVILVLILALFAPSRAAEISSSVDLWLSAQTNIQTWSAGFVQTRTLKALTHPLTAQGKVWFAAPNRFRWELGEPPQTLAVRQAKEMFVIYPRLKRAEKYPLDGSDAGQWRDALALLEAGFPRGKAEMDLRFKLLSVHTAADAIQLTLQPNAPGARRMMPQIKIAFGTNNYSLRSTELHFADGSILRNDFTNAILNPSLDPAIFEPKLGPGFKVVQPLDR